MAPVSVTQAAVGRSTVLALDNFANPFNIGLHIVVTGSATFNIEISPQDAMDAVPTVWTAPAGLSGLSASAAVDLQIPARAISINMTAGTGSVTLYLVQAGER